MLKDGVLMPSKVFGLLRDAALYIFLLAQAATRSIRELKEKLLGSAEVAAGQSVRRPQVRRVGMREKGTVVIVEHSIQEAV